MPKLRAIENLIGGCFDFPSEIQSAAVTYTVQTFRCLGYVHSVLLWTFLSAPSIELGKVDANAIEQKWSNVEQRSLISKLFL